MELGSVGIAYMEKVLCILNGRKNKNGWFFIFCVGEGNKCHATNTGFYFLLYHHLSVKAQTMLQWGGRA